MQFVRCQGSVTSQGLKLVFGRSDVLRLRRCSYLPETFFHGEFTMRRVIVPALLAIALVATSSTNASAFGLFGLCKTDACDACEPVCGAEAEPTCGCEAPVEPVCGAEEVDSCDGAACGGRLKGLFARMMAKHSCDDSCEPACGAEEEPTCGCEAPVEEPTCGAEEADSCDGAACGSRIKGLFARMMAKHGCDDSCEPACGAEEEPTCGCEAPVEPTCGCEPTCGA